MSIEDFFEELDAEWSDQDGAELELKIIGSAALFLQTRYSRGTKDNDIIETRELDQKTQEALLTIAGKDSPMFHRHRVYLEVVKRGIPLLPPEPLWHHYPL